MRTTPYRAPLDATETIEVAFLVGHMIAVAVATAADVTGYPQDSLLKVTRANPAQLSVVTDRFLNYSRVHEVAPAEAALVVTAWFTAVLTESVMTSRSERAAAE